MGEAAFLSTQWGLETEGKAGGSEATQGPPLPSPEGPNPCPYLQQVAVAIGPRAKAQEPFSGTQRGGASHLGEMRDVGWGRKQPPGPRQGFQLQILLLPVTS